MRRVFPRALNFGVPRNGSDWEHEVAGNLMVPKKKHLSLQLPVEFIDDLGKTESLQEILVVVAKWFKEMFEADRASITLPKDNSQLRVVALDGNRAIDLDMTVPIGGTMVGRVFSRAQAEICDDLAASADLDCLILASKGLGSCLDAPLRCGPHCYGTINVGRIGRNAFTHADRRKLEALAIWIAALVRVHLQVEELTYLSQTDPLTQIMNRRAFTEHFQASRAKGRRRAVGPGFGFGFAVVDIDHFKQINDSHGHDAGDVVLAFVGKMMKDFFRGDDFVARFGGEEFCILMQDVDEAGMRSALERFRIALGKSVVNHLSGQVSVTASIGAVLVLAPDAGMDRAYKSADVALYEAKANGRNRVQLASAING